MPVDNVQFELLQRVCRILSAMPSKTRQVGSAPALQRAVDAGASAAQEVLMRAGVRDLAADLVAASAILRSTGHFNNAEATDRFAALLLAWERRLRPRAASRRSGETS